MRLQGKLLFFVMFLAVSCLPVRDVSTLNMVSDYRATDKYFHPEFVAYNITDSTAKLFIKVLPGEFLFVRQFDEKFRSFINVYSETIISYESSKMIDSTSADYSFELTEKGDSQIISMNIPVKSPGKYLIHCIITDINKNRNDDFYIQLDRLTKPSKNDFLLLGQDDVPYFKSSFNQNEKIKVIYKDSTINRFHGKFYHRDFPLAAPPFSFDIHDDFNYIPDSSFIANSDELKSINLTQEGFYNIQTDSVGTAGLTLFRFGSGFPDVTSPKQMIESLRYLTTKKEYEEMRNNTSPKSAVENFWLTHGGTEEKSRNLIRKYYGRVRDSNRYFSSYTEGWKTDRGLIYIIFGSPGTIYKSSDTESWIYGTPNSALALNFFFVKVNNPFTENDFTLSRSPSYESNWYRAVEIWRQGRVYNSFY